MSICIINMNTTTLHEYFFSHYYMNTFFSATKCGSHSGAGPTFARNVRGFRAHGHPEQLGASVLSHKNKQTHTLKDMNCRFVLGQNSTA